MPRVRQLAPVILEEETREQLQGLLESTTLPQSVVLRAKMILASAEGLTKTEAGRRIGASPQAVGKWRRRLLESGFSELHDDLRPIMRSCRASTRSCRCRHWIAPSARCRWPWAMSKVHVRLISPRHDPALRRAARGHRQGAGTLRKAPPAPEVLTFLRLINKEVPPDFAIHLIADYYATHKHAKVET